ncbi:MAG: hypothetical protein WAL64_10190 [Candidatus Dormiibacterota bacterium]
MRDPGEEDPSQPSRPHSFQGWQRMACLVGVALMALLAVLLLTTVILELTGRH